MTHYISSHAQRLTNAFASRVENPSRLLALGVISRWVADLGTREASPIDDSWAELAEVPVDWLVELLDQNHGSPR